MGGLAAAAVVVVIHSRKVIMDQGVGVDHLECCHEGFGEFAASAVNIADAGNEEWTQALAAGEHVVAHGGGNGRSGLLSLRHMVGVGQTAVQNVLAVLNQFIHYFRIHIILFHSSLPPAL